LEAIKAVKTHNLFTRQAALEFNMNYCTLSYKSLLQKVPNI